MIPGDDSTVVEMYIIPHYYTHKNVERGSSAVQCLWSLNKASSSIPSTAKVKVEMINFMLSVHISVIVQLKKANLRPCGIFHKNGPIGLCI